MDSVNWRNCVLSMSDTMDRVVEVLEDNKQLAIGLVIDEDQKLVGTVTDGDIRRALIRNKNMDMSVTELMNAQPIVASSEDSQELIQKMMSDSNIARIPIVDSERRVVGIEKENAPSLKKGFDNPVLLMAGGFGKRLYPLTEGTPKPLLTIGDRPILEEMLIRLAQQGFHNIFISIHYRGDMIRQHFGSGEFWDVNIQYLEESEPLGTAGAVAMLPTEEFNGPFIVINGDLLTQIDYSRLLNFHREQGGAATLCVRGYDLEVPYGVIEAKGERVSRIVEKPVHRFFVNAGIYVLDKSVVTQVESGKYLDMTDLLQGYVDRGSVINMFPIHEYWLDIGRISEYQQAQRDANAS